LKLANVDGRLALVRADRAIDVATASGGRLPSDPAELMASWEAIRAWEGGLADGVAGTPLGDAPLGPPVVNPSQVFGIALNYKEHADEIVADAPDRPVAPQTFTKFPSCLAGPHDDLVLPSESVDWEVELVVVIGRACNRVAAASAWSHVAGLTVGQDVSERVVQMRPPVPQFSLGKSFPGFGPIGPLLVTPDELDDPDDLELGCAVNGEVVQLGRTSQLIFSVPELIEQLSSIVTLRPGDLIFTGTPGGVGVARSPQRFLAPGDELSSWVEGIGTMVSRCTAPAPALA
jgi:2,4-diketo-3-deoxy-L-fuconate hydrolase